MNVKSILIALAITAAGAALSKEVEAGYPNYQPQYGQGGFSQIPFYPGYGGPGGGGNVWGGYAPSCPWQGNGPYPGGWYPQSPVPNFPNGYPFPGGQNHRPWYPQWNHQRHR